jgi:hypothetical protein
MAPEGAMITSKTNELLMLFDPDQAKLDKTDNVGSDTPQLAVEDSVS